MSARNATLVAIVTIAAWVPRALAAAPDAGALIAGLARPAPASVTFTEVRFSSLLREPLIVSGELGYLGAGGLERRVTAPYRETTVIRGDAVRIERDGEAPRSFALKRAPELKSFLSAFTALLAGDAAALARDFTVTASGEQDRWSLELTPNEEHARRRLRAIVINGSGAEPRCLATFDVREGGSVLLFGVGATEPLVAADVSLDGLLARCRAE